MTSLADRRQLVELIAEARRNGARLHPCCDTLGLSLRTYLRWLDDGLEVEDRRTTCERPTPLNALSDAERQQIIDVCNEPRFADMAPSQIVPILADEGVYIASESSFYRVLRAAKQINPRGHASAPREPREPSRHLVTKPNQTWAWDITYLKSPISGQWYYLYMIHDVFSRKIVGWEVHDCECSTLAADLLERACLRENIVTAGLVLHSDNGSPMKGATMIARLQKLGVVPSLSRPSVSNDNASAEALFRTLKYVPHYPKKGFESLDVARDWVLNFVHWYNNDHKHSGIEFVSPNQRHTGEHIELLGHRDRVYKDAKARHPERWSRNTRNWTPTPYVWLNKPPMAASALREYLDKAA